jgi:ABC-type uncharacterized transport system permease subunit
MSISTHFNHEINKGTQTATLNRPADNCHSPYTRRLFQCKFCFVTLYFIILYVRFILLTVVGQYVNSRNMCPYKSC